MAKKVTPEVVVDVEVMTPEVIAKNYARQHEANEIVNFIFDQIKCAASSFLWIGQKLEEANEKKIYELFGFDNLYDFAEVIFRFKKTSTKNYISVYKAFNKKEQALSYSFSQLVELIPVADDPDVFEKFPKDKTIKEICELKLFDQNKDDTFIKFTDNVFSVIEEVLTRSCIDDYKDISWELKRNLDKVITLKYKKKIVKIHISFLNTSLSDEPVISFYGYTIGGVYSSERYDSFNEFEKRFPLFIETAFKHFVTDVEVILKDKELKKENKLKEDEYSDPSEARIFDGLSDDEILKIATNNRLMVVGFQPGLIKEPLVRYDFFISLITSSVVICQASGNGVTSELMFLCLENGVQGLHFLNNFSALSKFTYLRVKDVNLDVLTIVEELKKELKKEKRNGTKKN